MGIGLGNATMSGPPCMSEPYIRRGKVHGGSGNFAGLLLDFNQSVYSNSHAPGVVSTIFENFERVENSRADISFATDVSKNATHLMTLSMYWIQQNTAASEGHILQKWQS